MIWDRRFSAPAHLNEIPAAARRVIPLVTVRDLDGDPVADVAVTFLDFGSGDDGWAVAVTTDDDDNMLYLYCNPPFATAEQAAEWAEAHISSVGNPWAVVPLGRTDLNCSRQPVPSPTPSPATLWDWFLARYRVQAGPGGAALREGEVDRIRQHIGQCGIDVSRSPAPALTTLVTDYDDDGNTAAAPAVVADAWVCRCGEYADPLFIKPVLAVTGLDLAEMVAEIGGYERGVR